MREVIERVWFSPMVVAGAAFAWWAGSSASWDPWRVLTPLLGALAMVGVLRLSTADRRRFRWVPLVVACVLVAVMLDEEGSTAALTPARDVVLLLGVLAVGAAVLWVRGFFKPGARRGSMFEVVVLSTAVFAVSFTVLGDSMMELSVLERGLVVVFVWANSMAVGLVVVVLLADGSRNASAVMLTLGLLVTMGTAVWHLYVAIEGGAETALSWTFVCGFAVAVSGVWHPSVVRLRDTLGGPSRPVLAAFSVTAAVWSGAVVLAFGEPLPVTYAAGVACGVAATARAITAARTSWIDREESAIALVRGALVRDDERAHLKRLLHDDVLQPIVVASWLTRSAEARAALEELEARTRHVLNKLEPTVPQLREIPAVLERLFHASRRAALSKTGKGVDDPGTIDVEFTGAEAFPENEPVRAPLAFVAVAVVTAAATAGARRVRVEIELDEKEARMMVRDDAVGGAARKKRNERLMPVRDRVNDGAGEMLVGETPEGAGLVTAVIPRREVVL